MCSQEDRDPEKEICTHTHTESLTDFLVLQFYYVPHILVHINR